jgi:CHAT domain-containing protein
VKATLDNAQIFLGPRATEAQLRAALESGGNVHVATHAVLNHSNPMFSRIELYRGEAGSLRNDGFLDLHELLEMSVRSDLVYLSGCETGAGSSWSTGFRRERDYATLSQAILYAGSQNVIATLWRVDDAGASVFATRFYRALKSTDPSAALAQAQRETLRDRKYFAPRYWAPYTIGGSGYLKGRSQTPTRVAVQ